MMPLASICRKYFLYDSFTTLYVVLGALYKQTVKEKCALNGQCHTEVTLQAKQSKTEGKHQTSSLIVLD